MVDYFFLSGDGHLGCFYGCLFFQVTLFRTYVGRDIGHKELLYSHQQSRDLSIPLYPDNPVRVSVLSHRWSVLWLVGFPSCSVVFCILYIVFFWSLVSYPWRNVYSNYTHTHTHTLRQRLMHPDDLNIIPLLLPLWRLGQQHVPPHPVTFSVGDQTQSSTHVQSKHSTTGLHPHPWRQDEFSFWLHPGTSFVYRIFSGLPRK